MRKTVIQIIASIAVLGFASAAQASVLFEVDTNPGGTKLFLDAAKDATSSFGTVVTTDDVAISVTGVADFSNGFATIKPVKNVQLTTLNFTPVNANEFNSFSFRGQDDVTGQVIDVIIQDNQGNLPQTITFTEGSKDQDFARQGIIAAMSGETIKSIEIIDSGGFKQAEQFEFDLAGGVGTHGAVPEPATWAMFLIGFGAMGFMMRGLRRNGANATV